MSIDESRGCGSGLLKRVGSNSGPPQPLKVLGLESQPVAVTELIRRLVDRLGECDSSFESSQGALHAIIRRFLNFGFLKHQNVEKHDFFTRLSS